MKNAPVAAVLIFGVFVAGCQSASEKYKKEQLEIARTVAPDIETYAQMLLELMHIGIADIRMDPSGGKLFIDGGEYVGDEKEITLPVGTYEFKAVWQNGKEATRRIFVEALVGKDGGVNMDWREAGGRLKWEINHEEQNKTRVELVRP